MSIEKLAEFAKDGDKNLDNLDVSKGFLQSEKPERQWFNKLFNLLTNKVNEVVDNIDGLPPFDGGVLADTFVTVNGSINQRQVNIGFDDINSIKEIENANEGMRVYSKIHAGHFVFKKTPTSPVNDGTVLQGIGGVWEMDLRDAYYASWFATPNVQVDQAANLQKGYSYATSVGRPFIVDDVYYAKESNINTDMAAFHPSSATTVFNLLNNSVIAFTSKGEINLLPSTMPNYNLILGYNVEKVIVLNPKLNGDLLSHVGTDGEWGYGLTLYSCKDVYVKKPVISNMFGDGIYIGLAWGAPDTVRNNENILIEYPVIDRVRRNGISFTSGNNVRIIKPIIKSVYGALPESGIDIEPENKSGDGMKYASISKSIIDSPHILDCPTAIVLVIFGERTVDLRFTGTTVFEVTAEAFKQPAGFSITTRSQLGEAGIIPIQKGLIYFDNVVFISAVGATKTFASKINDFTTTALPIVFNNIDLQVDEDFGWGVGIYDVEGLARRQGITVNNILLREGRVLNITRPSKYTLFSHKVYMSDDIEVRLVGDVPTNLELTNDSHVSGTQYVTGLNGINSKHLAPRVIFDSATGDSENIRIIRVNTDTRKLDYHVTSAGHTSSKKLLILGINYKGSTSLITTSPDSSICFQNNSELTNTEVFYTFGSWNTDTTFRYPEIGSTAQRPPANEVLAGTLYFDTTLSKPLYSNGVVWKDAVGQNA